MIVQLERRFSGRGELSSGSRTVPVTLSAGYRLYEPDPVICKVFQAASAGFAFQSRDFAGKPTIGAMRGMTERGQSFWIPEFVFDEASPASGRSSNHEYEGVARFFASGDLETFDATGGVIVCQATIPSLHFAWTDDLADRPRVGNGTPEPRAIRWNTMLGEARLRSREDIAMPPEGSFFPAQLGVHHAIVRVDKDEVRLEVRSAGSVALGAILRDLQGALDSALWLISLISHKRIVWYEAQAYFVPEGLPLEPQHAQRSAYARCQQWFGYESQLDNRFVLNPERLKGGLFEQLVAAFELSPAKEAIRQAITFLLASYEAGYFTAQLGSLYAALEGLTDRLGDEHGLINLLDKASFKRLSKKLRDTIRENIEDTSTQQEIIGKLGELQRRSIRERLMGLFQRHNVPVERLWPYGANIADELQQILRRRNEFIHQGKFVSRDDEAYLYDFERLQWIIELWVLKLLGCPDEALDLSQPGWNTYLTGLSRWRYPNEIIL